MVRCKNGLAINFTEKYVCRRDLDCIVIGDEEETDKVYFRDLFDKPFDEVRLEKQPEVGDEEYDAGMKILYEFFQLELSKFRTSGLDTLGKKIITCCLDKGKVEDYLSFIPMTM